jgi:hypothetical protein
MFAARNMMFAGVSAAGAYISAVEIALGSSITSTQKAALNAFVLAEQAAARWTSHKRLYLPIWANAAANAICIKSLTSGTFGGTVTHGAGFVQGDGSTGYFNFGTDPSSLGLSAGNSSACVLITQANVGTATTVHMGVSTSYPNYYGLAAPGNANLKYVSMAYNTTNGEVTGFLSGSEQVGILHGTKSAGVLNLRTRKNSGASALASLTCPATGNVPTTAINAMAGVVNGTRGSFSNARYGAWMAGLAMTQPNTDAFTLNLKTLWETCTGLSLP